MSATPSLLDLFAGGGGAGEGYRRAGFNVTGVELNPARAAQNPNTTIVTEALAYVTEHGHKYDAIHASPPCTGYTRGTVAVADRTSRYDRLIAVTRDVLTAVGKPYVIENVEDARPEMIAPVTLCWTMFNHPGSVLDEDGTPLWMRRHRLFDSNLPLMSAGGCTHPSNMQCAGAYGGARRDKNEARYVRKGGYVPSTPVMRTLLGTPWMSEQSCQLSIPPAYTQFLGEQILEHLS